MRAKNPLITVYITNYNYASFIELSIKSVLNQSMDDFELLIIDDGSTDNSKEIIERYRSNEKVSIIYQLNKGLNVSNNVAMRASRGKYIMRLDADDFLENKALEKMSAILEQDESLGLVFPDYYYVDAFGERIGQEVRHDFDKDVSLYDQPAHGACTMIRLEFLKTLGGYNESFTCQDGYDLWLKFIHKHKVTNINEPLFSYRRHGKNLTANEDRILGTRREIKETFVNKNFEVAKALVVIPVRESFVNGESWPLMKIDNKTILESKIEVCLSSKGVEAVVVISDSSEIIDYCKSLSFSERLIILKRPERFAGFNSLLRETLELAVDYAVKRRLEFSTVISVGLEYPFVKTEIIDDLIHTQVLFDSDSVISVRPDFKIYYKHNGHSLVPVLNQYKFTKLEREAQYKGVGGLVLLTLESFKEQKDLRSRKISHIVLDEKSAFGVYSEFDFEMFKNIVANNELFL